MIQIGLALAQDVLRGLSVLCPFLLWSVCTHPPSFPFRDPSCSTHPSPSHISLPLPPLTPFSAYYLTPTVTAVLIILFSVTEIRVLEILLRVLVRLVIWSGHHPGMAGFGFGVVFLIISNVWFRRFMVWLARKTGPFLHRYVLRKGWVMLHEVYENFLDVDDLEEDEDLLYSLPSHSGKSISRRIANPKTSLEIQGLERKLEALVASESISSRRLVKSVQNLETQLEQILKQLQGGELGQEDGGGGTGESDVRLGSAAAAAAEIEAGDEAGPQLEAEDEEAIG